MAGGNPNKVNAIVDEIVENNNVFKLKSSIEQVKEKESMARSINSAISVLNEVGQELVLQDLSVDPDEKFKRFIDSVGNVDISGLTQMTTTIVKAKIEEAEREGIDLRQGQPVFRENNKTLIVESVLTIAVIDTMVNNFNNLSYEQKKDLFDNWDRLTSPQKSFVLKSQSDILAQKASHAKDSETRDLLGKASDIANDFSTQIKDEEQLTDEQISQQLELLLRQYPNLQKSYNRLNHDNVSPQIIYHKLLDEITNYIYGLTIDVDITDKDSPNFQSLQGTLEQETNNKYEREFFNNPNMLEYFGLTKETAFKLTQEEILVKRSIYLLRTSPEILNYFSITQEDAELLSDEECNKMYEQYTINLIKKDEQQIKENNLDNRLLQEIEQLPSALAKANFSQEEIKTNLIKYINFLSKIDNSDIEQLKPLLGTEQIEQFFNKRFKKIGITENMADILSKINYNEQLFNILGNEEQKKEFFEQFDKFINQEQDKEKQIQLDGELEEIFSKYFQDNAVDMNVSAIEDQKEQANTEQTKQSMLEEQPKEPKLSEQSSPVAEIKTVPEEHTQEIVTSPEQEISKETSQNMAMVEQDNSFIGKIKRVFANMKDMKNKDNSKGFFARLGASIQTIFGNKKEEFYTEQDEISTYAKPEDKIQPRTNPKQIDYLNQHFEVNTQEAIRKTEESKKSKEFLSTEDKTADKEEK